MRDINFIKREVQYELQAIAADWQTLGKFNLDMHSKFIVRNCLVLKYTYKKAARSSGLPEHTVKEIYLASVMYLAEQIGHPSTPPVKEVVPVNIHYANKPLSEISFNYKAFRLFRHLKIKTVGELLKYSYRDLIKVRNMNKGTISDINRELSFYGLKLND